MAGKAWRTASVERGEQSERRRGSYGSLSEAGQARMRPSRVSDGARGNAGGRAWISRPADLELLHAMSERMAPGIAAGDQR